MYYILNYIIVKISCQHTRRLFSIFLNYVLPLVQVWFKTAWHLPFCFKSHFCKSPQTIEKSEQFRCHLNCSFFLGAGAGFEPTTSGLSLKCRSSSCVVLCKKHSIFFKTRTLDDIVCKNNSPDCFYCTNPTSHARRSHNKKQQTLNLL